MMNDRWVQHVAGEQAWAHWEYDPSEWAAFDRVDWELVRNTSWLILILGSLLYLAIMALLWVLLQPSRPVVQLDVMLTAGILLLTVLIIVMASGVGAARQAKKRYEARHHPAAAYRVTFSSNGIWEAGVSFPFRRGGTAGGHWRLNSVTLTANPAVLHFKLIKRNTNGSPTGASQQIRILVPRGHELEAELLRQRYYSLVIEPWKQPVNAESEPM